MNLLVVSTLGIQALFQKYYKPSTPKPSTCPSIPSPLKVVIVGGSLSGLMYGLVLAHAGHHVTILERSTTYQSSTSHGAGLAFGSAMQTFLARYDRGDQVSFTVPATSVRIVQLDSAQNLSIKLAAARDNVSWGNLFRRLRDSFDGECALHGSSTSYVHGAMISALQRDGDGWSISWTKDIDIEAGNTSPITTTLQADLLIAADGANSLTRDLLQPHYPSLIPRCTTPSPANYVAWRGTVPETLATPETASLLSNTLATVAATTGYAVCYHIPGPPTPTNENGTAPGHRLLNFVWYAFCTEEEQTEILLDVAGIRHLRGVGAGKMRAKVWAKQKQVGEQTLAPACAELVALCEQPFVQIIDDLPIMKGFLPGASSAIRNATAIDHETRLPRGSAMLVGEAYAILRPHTAMGVNVIANNALAFAEVLAGRASMRQWSDGCEFDTQLNGRLSRCFGEAKLYGNSKRVWRNYGALVWFLCRLSMLKLINWVRDWALSWSGLLKAKRA